MGMAAAGLAMQVGRAMAGFGRAVEEGSWSAPVGRRRRLDQLDTGRLLDRMATLRAEIARLQPCLLDGSAPDRMLGSLAGALDRSAFMITGDAQYLAHPGSD